MPIFEYRCQDCGTKFERIVTSGEDKQSCKQCGSEHVARLLSVFAVVGASDSAREPGPCGACGAARRGMCGE
jgi:putative FmdB family regulatory protein